MKKIIAGLVVAVMLSVGLRAEEWRQVPYSTGLYGVNAGATWTVQEADQAIFSYHLGSGKTLFWEVVLNGTSVGGTNPYALGILLPNNYELEKDCMGLAWVDDNGSQQVAIVYGDAYLNYVNVYKIGAPYFSTSNNNTRVRFTITCEIE